MRLDLTGSDELQRDHAMQLDEIAEELRQPFAELVRRISAPFGAEPDWWVTPLASRNTYICALFLRLCKVILIRRIIAKSSISEVVVDAPAMAHLLRDILPSSVRVSCTVSALRWWLRCAASIIRRLAIATYVFAGRFLFSKLIPSAGRDFPSEPIVVVDTIIYPESIQEGVLRDRHYPGLLNSLEESERCRVYRAPSYYGVRNYFRFFRRLRKCKDNLLLAEDYLGLTDYVFAISHILRTPRRLRTCEFDGMNITLLVREAYVENLANLGSMEGLLRYRFAKRLREVGIRLHRVVEWFENQEIDHGAMAGWRTFYPETEVIGYQGFLASRTYLCMFPLAVEKTLNLLPQTLAVMGSALVAPSKEFCPDMRVVTAPAFRFQAVWRDRSGEPDANWFTILIALPIMKRECTAIMAKTGEAAKMITNNQRPYRFYIKPHPAWRKKDVDSLVSEFPAVYEVINGDFDQALDMANVLVSAASSTCVQAIARGIPVAIVGQPGLLTQNPIPNVVDTRLWTVCYTSSDLTTTLKRLSKLGEEDGQELMKLGCSHRAVLFEPVTPTSVKYLLGFMQKTHLPYAFQSC